MHTNYCIMGLKLITNDYFHLIYKDLDQRANLQKN